MPPSSFITSITGTSTASRMRASSSAGSIS
jgi:hypothetical protein